MATSPKKKKAASKKQSVKSIETPAYGWHKLANATPLSPKQAAVIDSILHGEKMTREGVLQLPEEVKQALAQIMSLGMNVLAGEDREQFLNNIVEAVSPESRKAIWEHNHTNIIWAISKLTREKQRFPTRHEIVACTQLSRNTIDKHLKAYFNSKEYNSRKEDFLLMREQVLATVFNYASEGDMKAARIFIEATDPIAQLPIIGKQQNNFIQINGLTITQEQIKDLPAEKQAEIQAIISLVAKPVMPNQ